MSCEIEDKLKDELSIILSDYLPQINCEVRQDDEFSFEITLKEEKNLNSKIYFFAQYIEQDDLFEMEMGDDSWWSLSCENVFKLWCFVLLQRIRSCK